MRHLTVAQRYTIQVLKEEGFSQIEIAKRIGRNKSVVSRELKRNCDQRSGKYKAELAERKCANRHKTKKKKVRFTSDIQENVENLLRQDYSPEQVVGFSKLRGDDCVSIGIHPSKYI